jgi:hypothetical protein
LASSRLLCKFTRLKSSSADTIQSLCDQTAALYPSKGESRNSSKRSANRMSGLVYQETRYRLSYVRMRVD